MTNIIRHLLAAGATVFFLSNAQAQVAPSATEYAAYTGLHAAAAKGNIAAIGRPGANKTKLNDREAYGQTTSRYDGTALIAAAHLGHAEVVRMLIKAGAPLDHVNNLNWTALIEPIVLGDGGPNHIACQKALVHAGADVNIAGGNGVSPLQLVQHHGLDETVRILKAAGAK